MIKTHQKKEKKGKIWSAGYFHSCIIPKNLDFNFDLIQVLKTPCTINNEVFKLSTVWGTIITFTSALKNPEVMAEKHLNYVWK